MLKMASLYNTMTDIQYQNYAKIARLNRFQSGVCFDFISSLNYEWYFFYRETSRSFAIWLALSFR